MEYREITRPFPPAATGYLRTLTPCRVSRLLSRWCRSRPARPGRTYARACPRRSVPAGWPALVPLPCVPLVRAAERVAPQSTLRDAIVPTPRQQGGRRGGADWSPFLAQS